jgi:hypothetical protein
MKTIKNICLFFKDLVKNSIVVGVNISETEIRLEISDVRFRYQAQYFTNLFWSEYLGEK